MIKDSPPPTVHPIDYIAGAVIKEQTARPVLTQEAMMADQPWICPRCNRVYGPATPSCGPCNAAIDAMLPIVGRNPVPAGKTGPIPPSGSAKTDGE